MRQLAAHLVSNDWHGSELQLHVLGEGTGSLAGFYVPDAISHSNADEHHKNDDESTGAGASVPTPLR